MGPKYAALLIETRWSGWFRRRTFKSSDTDDGVLNSIVGIEDEFFVVHFRATFFVILRDLDVFCRGRFTVEEMRPDRVPLLGAASVAELMSQMKTAIAITVVAPRTSVDRTIENSVGGVAVVQRAIARRNSSLKNTQGKILAAIYLSNFREEGSR